MIGKAVSAGDFGKECRFYLGCGECEEINRQPGGDINYTAGYGCPDLRRKLWIVNGN